MHVLKAGVISELSFTLSFSLNLVFPYFKLKAIAVADLKLM